MVSHTTPARADEADGLLFDSWFDPIEDGLRAKVRGSRDSGHTICPSVVLISMFSGVEVQPQARLGVRLPLKNGRSA